MKEEEVTLTKLGVKPALEQQVEIVDPEGSCKKANRKPIKINWHRHLSLLTKIEIFSPYETKYTTFDLKYGFEYSRTKDGCLLGKLQNKFKIWEASQ